MTTTAQDFARDLTSIVDASANALLALNRVLELQQHNIVALASAGGVPPNAAAPGGAAAARVPSATAVTGAATTATTPNTPSPEEVLAHAEKLARGLLAHSPEIALANIYQASAHAIGLALLNTVSAQQQLNITTQTLVTVIAKMLLDRRAAT